MLRQMKAKVFAVILGTALAFQQLAKASSRAEVVDSRVMMRAGQLVSEVTLRLAPSEGRNSAALGIDATVRNSSRTTEAPKIYTNDLGTIIGFNASTGRGSYNINLVTLDQSDRFNITQRLNDKLRNVLKAGNLKSDFPDDGLYLSKIRGRIITIEYRSDNAKTFFSADLEVTAEGGVKLLAVHEN